MTPRLFRTVRGALAFWLLAVPLGLAIALGVPLMATYQDNPSNFTATTAGTITGVHAGYKRSNYCDYTYLSPGDGSTVHKKDSCSEGLAVGETVTLHYDPRHPDDARLTTYGESQNVFMYLVLGFLGFIVVLFFAYPFRYRWKYAVGLADAWSLMRARRRGTAPVEARAAEIRSRQEGAGATVDLAKPGIVETRAGAFRAEKMVFAGMVLVGVALLATIFWLYDRAGYRAGPSAATFPVTASATPTPNAGAPSPTQSSTRSTPRPSPHRVPVPPTPASTALVRHLVGDAGLTLDRGTNARQTGRRITVYRTLHGLLDPARAPGVVVEALPHARAVDEGAGTWRIRSRSGEETITVLVSFGLDHDRRPIHNVLIFVTSVVRAS